MPSLSSGLLRAGLALKLSQIKLAVRSYLRDRTSQAADTATSYVIAAGLFAAAGIFLIAACLVGMSALFRWIEINYGLFPAFGVVGSLLLLTAVICAAVATARLRRPPPRFPSLNGRLRVAIKSNPVKPNQIEAARDAAVAILLTPSAPTSRRKPRPPRAAAYGRWDNRKVQAGLIVAASLLGWAALRRRQVRRAVA